MNKLDFESILKAHSVGGKWNKTQVIACMEDVQKLMTPDYSNRGRKLSDEAKELRETLVGYIKKPCTSADLSMVTGKSQLVINNTLTYLEKQGKVVRIGKAERQGKGRKCNIWNVTGE